MTRAISVILGLGLLVTAGVAAGVPRPFQERAAVRESLEHVSRKQWASWLTHHGFDASRYATYQRPETSGLRLVGKYGRGPSHEVMAQDTIMALTLGSECALLSIANPDRPRVLNEIQLDYLPHQSLLSDTLLLTGGNGIQIWSIASPTQPVRLSEIPYAIGDFSIVDTFLYFIGSDTFFAYSFANPASPHRIGFCVDSGYVTSATQNTAVLIQPNDVLGFVDVSDPAHPQQVGMWPAWPFAATARGGLCCAAFANPSNQDESWFLTLDISNPASPHQLARLDSVCGFDIFLCETLAFVSGRDDAYDSFRIVNIADSTRPKKLGTCDVWNDNWGVWADVSHNRAYIASEPSGLAVVDITDPNAPHVDTCVMTADLAVDIWLDGDRAYVSDYRAGLRVLDVSDPTRPAELGGFDSLNATVEAAVARDSFAFTGWWAPPYFRSFDVSDPSHPEPAGGALVQTIPEAMVLRDTFVYLAGRLRFNVVNVAQPREPVLVGSCVLSGDVWDLDVEDSMAYVTSNVLTMISIARPDSPRVVATWNPMVAVDVEDTVAYTIGSGAVWAVGIARPSQPYVLDTVGIPDWKSDVVVGESLLFAGGQTLYVIDKRDPGNLRTVGKWTPPEEFRRLLWSPPYIYAACYEAGVCILETLPTGIAERSPSDIEPLGVLVYPSVTRGVLAVDLGCPANGIYVRNATGRRIAGPFRKGGDASVRRLEIDMSGYPDGVYFIESATTSTTWTAKVIKTGRR